MRVSHLNFNHLYYFWHVCKEGSVVGAADALYLTPQTITGQIKALEERLGGKLFKRQGRGLVPSELGQLIFRYADKMFTLSQEMLDIVTYSRESNLLFDVGVADALSKRLVSKVLEAAVVEHEKIHLRCFESTHEMLLEQLSQHKLDMILSDCPVDSSQQEGLFSVKLGECKISFYCRQPIPEKSFPKCLEERRLLIPGRRSMLGRKLLTWIRNKNLQVEVLGEFDDAALMKAFGMYHNAIFIAPSFYANDIFADSDIVEIGRLDAVQEEYYVIFAERMIQHPAVQRICNKDFSALFSSPPKSSPKKLR
ncbi:transcriptional activator NhaR [Xenorhabdus nematophila]|uniref:Transcriptional activator protein NhaR n=1 Tax=Xenorhabdus nematophila (strain ATCC 19061 / DSM 3370 / CCUG 14189 / LMG 1036 / NCIMB 9965 / AN6) TaxID=406817 RepID=D3VB40_XENNA|nr:transcriptional activator NhaR [Xenorhabdus nematophila]CEE90568.1 transcriptional activator of cation transport (LysR family) [Xenorhabdus nematophila str. Anatoliense]CEF28745.1 transcriptional activator of cation transport (LysR family) [Xenorhabdus nematophila str. Websteri]AYA42328.1 transcriptional activator NhaR [Xenorhabdus nematophila]KHD29204.1 transcriptional regulator [Xenorhabdus nematophila]MBA0021057.1 transcriptional activator NhaR [Xenorhabdus nematophila]